MFRKENTDKQLPAVPFNIGLEFENRGRRQLCYICPIVAPFRGKGQVSSMTSMKSMNNGRPLIFPVLGKTAYNKHICQKFKEMLKSRQND